jgi:hypothetical protein
VKRNERGKPKAKVKAKVLIYSKASSQEWALSKYRISLSVSHLQRVGVSRWFD